MADETTIGKKPGPPDAPGSGPIKARESSTTNEEQQPQPSDWRLLPGGAHGATSDPGMSSLDWDTVFSAGEPADDK